MHAVQHWSDPTSIGAVSHRTHLSLGCCSGPSLHGRASVGAGESRGKGREQRQHSDTGRARRKWAQIASTNTAMAQERTRMGAGMREGAQMPWASLSVSVSDWQYSRLTSSERNAQASYTHPSMAHVCRIWHGSHGCHARHMSGIECACHSMTARF